MRTIKQQGFTLVEVLIALFIFAIIAVVIAHTLQVMISASQIGNRHASQLEKLQMTSLTMQNDVAQFIDRPITDVIGQKAPSMLLSTSPHEYFEFSRGGFANPDATLSRSTLLRVAYLVKNGNLIRRTWPRLDRSYKTQSLDKVLLSHVSDFTVTLYNQQKQSLTAWPQYNSNDQALPIAVKLHYCLNQQGCVDQVIALHNAPMFTMVTHL